MLTLSTRSQITIGSILALLLVATRSHHFASITHLPGASWAVFFLAGVYLRSIKVLPALFALTWILDFASYTWGGGSGFCLTPAYVFLIPAYTTMWLAGLWFAGHYAFGWRALLMLSLAAFAGAFICELLSSGGFYFFSGRFVDTTLTEFGTRVVKYFPHSLQSVAFYVGIAAAVHVMFCFIGIKTARDNAATKTESGIYGG